MLFIVSLTSIRLRILKDFLGIHQRNVQSVSLTSIRLRILKDELATARVACHEGFAHIDPIADTERIFLDRQRSQEHKVSLTSIRLRILKAGGTRDETGVDAKFRSHRSDCGY